MMPYSLTYLDDGKGFVIELTGNVSTEEIIQVEHEVRSRDKARFPCNYGLYDAEAASVAQVRTEDVRASAFSFRDEHLPQDVVFAFVARDALSLGLARMWLALAQRPGWETGVFPDRAVANAWIKEHVGVRFGFVPVLKETPRNRLE